MPVNYQFKLLCLVYKFNWQYGFFFLLSFASGCVFYIRTSAKRPAAILPCDWSNEEQMFVHFRRVVLPPINTGISELKTC